MNSASPVPSFRDSKVEASYAESSSINEAVDIPDGGLRAWIVVAGAFCLSFATFGYVVSWGAFQEYYQTTALSSRSPSDIAWIGSLQYSLIFLPGLITGYLFDLGYFRVSLAAASVLYIASNFLIAECQQYWQFILCQGVALGISAGWIYVPCAAIVAHWFKERRPIAFSIISMGSSLGGIIFPIMFRQLLPQIGFRWTVRVIAFINLACFIFGNLTMKARLPPKGKSAANWRALATRAYILYTLSTLLAFLGLYTLLTFLSVSAVVIGINSALAFYLVGVCNATSAAGRLLGGVLALRAGALNVMIACTALAAAMTYVWPFVASHAVFIVLVCVYGVASGAFVSLFPIVTMRLGSVEDVGLRTGVQMTVMSLGALAGPPISGAIQQRTGSFHDVGIYAGSMVVLSVIVMIVARWAHVGKLIGGVF
ncbi:MFS general substrate transporter [Phanerochaete sordida]|uniref:MFS general substrate transporter n=1 Tax=Phanerochaete sordida TaxID=48140 RepID=A0A9P3GC82_9APHY|nr:MFS general substrate transporter [Phanerochaete sordida]